MNETELHRILVDELRTLLSDLEHGLEPSNIVLHEVVVREIRKQNPSVQ